jgi:hypothetical protein
MMSSSPSSIALSWVDDILVYNNSFSDHLIHLQAVLEVLMHLKLLPSFLNVILLLPR